MKKRKFIYGAVVLSFILAVGSCVACSKKNAAQAGSSTEKKQEVQKQEEPKKKEAYEAGTIDGTHYESKWIGIQFDAPEGFHMYTDKELKARSDDAGETDAAEREKDLSLDMRASAENGSAISVTVERNDDTDMTAADYAKGVQEEMLKNEGTNMKFTNKGEISEVTLAGETYACLKMEYELEDMKTCNETYFRMIGDCAVAVKLEYAPEQTADRDLLYNAVKQL